METTTTYMNVTMVTHVMHPVLKTFLDIALPYIIIGACLIAMILILHYDKHQPWWCACGSCNPFNWDVKSMHNSQHVVDPYTFSHFLHGVIFYWVVAFIPALSIHHKAMLVFFTAVLWEVVENSQCVIDKYRKNTISLGYNGDSITNSISDTIFCMLGFVVAYFSPWYVSLIIAIVDELVLALWIRDNMILNGIMLIYPFECIKDWQNEMNKKPKNGKKTEKTTENSGSSDDPTDGHGPENVRIEMTTV